MNIMGSTTHMHPPDVARVWWRNYNHWHWLNRINMPRRLPVEPIWGTQSWWLQWLTSRNRTTCQLIESLFPQVQLSRDGDSKSGKNINSSLLITRSCAPVNTLMFCFILGYVNHGSLMNVTFSFWSPSRGPTSTIFTLSGRRLLELPLTYVE